MNEATWKRLVAKIRESNVVPVVGTRLLVGPDGETSLQGTVAARLLQDCGEDPSALRLPQFRELNEAVSHLRQTVDAQDLYDCVNDAICAVTADDRAIPLPIRHLAEIADFRLFVTVTPDNLLARALRRRCAVNEIVHAPNLPSSESKDLPSDWKNRTAEAQLLYLFGKARSAPMFAIHDEDVLEYAHNLMVHGGQVKEFLKELQQRNLLLLGCSFPDWLSRFLLRATNQRRLSDKGDKRSWLIEPLQSEESLTCFLRSYSKETEILSDMPPADFVAELHARWMAACGADAAETTRPPEESVPAGAMFFISYSRKTDLPKAEALYQALIRQGVSESEVWFDRKSIEPGQDFQRSILDGIRSCRYFLPLLSEAANQRERAFVFREWEEANGLLPEMNREFVFPIVVDAQFEPSRYRARPVLTWADKHIDFGHAPDGVPDARLEARLRQMVRSCRQVKV
jgi:hypothetical protein